MSLDARINALERQQPPVLVGLQDIDVRTGKASDVRVNGVRMSRAGFDALAAVRPAVLRVYEIEIERTAEDADEPA